MLKDSIVKTNFTAYLNKYDTKVYTFNKATEPLFNSDPVPSIPSILFSGYRANLLPFRTWLILNGASISIPIFSGKK